MNQNAYVIGGDVLGENANLSTTDLCRERPMSADSARRLIALCVRRLQGKGIGISPTAHQLVKIDESIVVSGRKKLPDSAADVLCGLAARAVGECEILGSSHDPRPYWAQGINPYLEVEPIYDYPPDDEWLVPKAGGGYQKVILGADAVGAGEMVPGGWWYTGSHRGPWWGGNGPYMDVDDFVDPMSRVDPSILGDVAGLTDIQASQARMNALKPVTLAVARALLSSGQEVINKAIAGSKQPWYRPDLPRESARNNVLWKLRWHAEQLNVNRGEPNTVLYESANDLKKWVMEAFIENNAVLSGPADAQWLVIQWDLMWDKITTALAAIPKAVRGALISAASGTIEAVTGIPAWGWGLIFVGGVVVIGLIAWALVSSKAGAAVAGVAARRYLP